MSQWRQRARAIIDKAREENPKATGDELRAILKPLYDYHPRSGWPYKCWLDEVKRACGRSRPKKKVEGFGGKSWLDCREDE